MTLRHSAGEITTLFVRPNNFLASYSDRAHRSRGPSRVSRHAKIESLNGVVVPRRRDGRRCVHASIQALLRGGATLQDEVNAWLSEFEPDVTQMVQTVGADGSSPSVYCLMRVSGGRKCGWRKRAEYRGQRVHRFPRIRCRTSRYMCHKNRVNIHQRDLEIRLRTRFATTRPPHTRNM
jgi:hypothetical protein